MEERTKRLNIRLTPDEYNQIFRRMNDAGVRNMSAFIRQMALKGYLINLDCPDLKEVLRMHSIISNNLNQCARKANETGNIYYEDIEELKILVREETVILREILESVLCLNP